MGDSSRVRSTDALILDFLDVDRPVSRSVVLRIKADREEVALVRSRLEYLVREGLVFEVPGGRLTLARLPRPGM